MKSRIISLCMNYKYTREHECCLDQMISMVFSNLYNSMEITFFCFVLFLSLQTVLIISDCL